MKWEVSDFFLFAEFINVWQNSRFTSFRIIELEIEKKQDLLTPRVNPIKLIVAEITLNRKVKESKCVVLMKHLNV